MDLDSSGVRNRQENNKLVQTERRFRFLPSREFPWEHLGRRRRLLLVLFRAGLGTLGLEQVSEFRGSSGLNCRSSSSVKWSLNGKSGLVRLAAADEHMQFPA